MGCKREILIHTTTTAGLVATYAVAISSTLLRLGLRYRRRQLYWDDFWALIALITTVFIAALFLCICFVSVSELSFSITTFLGLVFDSNSNYYA